MSTRALVTFFNDDLDTKLVTIYKHYDGYPSNLGAILAKFLTGMKIVDGISFKPSDQKVANGAGCLAAQFIALIKNSVGDVYITDEDIGDIEYFYHIKINNGSIVVDVFDTYNNIFSGNAEDLLKFCESYND